ncbi:MAG: ATP-binding protein [Alphaproteobacteria bacterium]
MPIWNRTVRRLITVRYWAALGLIAVLATAAFIVTVRTIDMHRQRVDIIDHAAKQRMFSQRIPFLANELATATDDDLRRLYRVSLAAAVRNMARRHDVLSLSEPAPMPKRTRSVLHGIYYSDLRPFDGQMDRFLQYAQELLESGDFRPDSPRLVRLTNMGTSSLLETHELVYNLLRTEALVALERFVALAAVLWILALAVIGLEVPLFFRPMAGRTAEELRNLDRARQQAESDAATARASHEDSVTYMRLMNHEMRTPLNAVMGMASLLRMSGLPEKQDAYARQIQEAASQLFGLINHALDFRELEADLVRLRTARISPGEELDRVCAIFRPLATEKGLEIQCSADERLAPGYLADGARIRQILTHLVNNALKFTEEGSISLRVLHAGEAGAGRDLVRFEVEDTGIGVPPELREQIFREWRQAEEAMARRYGGLGLGLAIARRLVELMEGEIGVQGLDGKGSLFWFTLPLKRAEQFGEEAGDVRLRSA